MLVTPITACPFKVSAVAPILLSDGLIIYRKRDEGLLYYIDFSQNGGVTWELGIVTLMADEDSIIIQVDQNPAGYRQRVSGRNYYIDQTLTPTGFAGSEGTDWETIYSITM